MENSHKDYTTMSLDMQAPFRIDPEFENKIPPIGKDEFEQLDGNILLAGKVFDPLVVWKEENILVDGHNRWKIIQKYPGIEYKVRYESFPDKWAAFEWMYKNQLGRRNLTDEQRDYTIGKMYEARKNSQGGDRRSEEFSSGHNVHLKDRREIKSGTSGEIGKELGIDGRTVRRDEHFAKGVDALRKVSPEAADKVLTGKANVPKVFVQQIGHMEQEKVEAAAEIILNNMKPETKNPAKPARPPRPRMTDEDRKSLKEIEAIVADMRDPTTTPEFTIELLIEDIELNGQTYVEQLANTLADRSNLATDENKPRIAAAIDKVVENILKVRESLYEVSERA